MEPSEQPSEQPSAPSRIASDAELLDASRRGERAAFGVLIERYQGVVCAVSYSRTGDHTLSEDVAQDTFLAAWRQLDTLREPARLRAWLCGIARNLARKARRRTAREAPLEAGAVFEGANPFDRAAEAQSQRVVRDALSRVPETYRDALVLYYREQRSVRDVAAALGITEAAALQRLSRGRRYLADGINDLVERSLRGARAPRSLVAGVLAALPTLAPSPADAATGLHGGTRLKLAVAAAAVIAAGTAIYVDRSPGGAPVAFARRAGPAAAAITGDGAARARPALVPATPAGAPPEAAASAGPDPSGPPVARPTADRAVDRATIERLGLYRGPSRGPERAAVTIVAFTDLLCRHCGSALGTLDELWDDHPGALRVVVKQLPVRKGAELPAEAALAADAQGKFWPLHDLMLAHQDELTYDGLLALAERAGLDVPAFRRALDQRSFAAAVAADRATATELELDAVPAFVVNGKRVIGGPPEDLRAAIEQALQAP